MKAGRLVTPFGGSQAVSFSYFFVTTPAKERLMRVELFRNWLQAEVKALRTIGDILSRNTLRRLDIAAAE